MKNFICFLFFVGVIVVGTLVFSACNPFTAAEKETELQLSPPQTAEDKDYVVEAHRLGVRLYASARRVEQATSDRDEQQKRLQPVYTQIEDFIFHKMSAYTNRITSIIVIYHN